MASLDRSARELAARQGGVLSAEQAYRLGFTRYQIDYRLRTGMWSLEAGLGYRLIPPRDHIDRVRSAAALLPKAVVSHQTAAELHSFPSVQRGLAVVTVHTRTTHSFPGVRVRRAHDLLEEHVCEQERMLVTTPARTLVDLAASLPEREFVELADRMLLTRRIRHADFGDVVAKVARRGRPGSAVLRRVLEEHGQGAKPTVLERRGRGLLIDAGLPRPISEYPIPWAPHRRFDDAYPECCLAIEWDSVRWHTYGDAFELDRERDRECVLHGWRMLRFTWRDVTERPQVVVDTVRKALGL